MCLDMDLLKQLSIVQQPVLHLYSWKEESATYGHFIDPKKVLDVHAAEHCGLSLAKRPTGGGVVFHLSDLAFSILMPSSHPRYSSNTLQNYAMINAMVFEAIEVFLGAKAIPDFAQADGIAKDAHARYFCMAKPTKYDVLVEGKKVGGAAQRRTRHGFLHQGTINIALPSAEYLMKVLLPGTQVLSSMLENSYSLLDAGGDREQLAKTRAKLTDLLIGTFVRFCRSHLTLDSNAVGP